METSKTSRRFSRATSWARLSPSLKPVVQSTPNFAFGYVWRGKVCEARGEVQKAREAYTRGIEVSTLKNGLCFNLGMLEFNHGPLKEAARWWIRSTLIQLQSKPPLPSRMFNAAPFLYLGFLAESLGEPQSSSILIAAAQTGPHGFISLNETAKQQIAEKAKAHKDSEIALAVRQLTTRHVREIEDIILHRAPRCRDCGGDLGRAPSHVSIPCKCGASARIPVANINKQLGTMVNHYAGKGLCPFYTYVPPTVLCPSCGTNLKKNWESLIVHDEPEEAAEEFSNTGIQRARALARQLKEAHGPLTRVHFVSEKGYEINFRFADGARLSSGTSTGDIANLFAFGYWGGGPKNLRAFLDEMGVPRSINEIVALKAGAAINLAGARVSPHS